MTHHTTKTAAAESSRNRFPLWLPALAAAFLLYMAWYLCRSDGLTYYAEDGTLISSVSGWAVFAAAAVLTLAAFALFAWASAAPSYERLFLVLWLTLGLVWSLAQPVLSEPDAKTHLMRTVDIVNGEWVSSKDENGDASDLLALPMEWVEGDSIYLSFYTASGYLDYSLEDEAYLYEYNNTAVYSPFSYLTQALGWIIARLFTDRLIPILLVMRTVNYLITGAVYLLAIRLMPYSKKYILWAALMPMNLHEALGIDTDAMVSALVVLLMAACLYLRCDPNSRLTRPVITLLYVTAFLVSQYKIVYVGACLMLFLIPYTKFSDDTHQKPSPGPVSNPHSGQNTIHPATSGSASGSSITGDTSDTAAKARNAAANADTIIPSAQGREKTPPQSDFPVSRTTANTGTSSSQPASSDPAAPVRFSRLRFWFLPRRRYLLHVLLLGALIVIASVGWLMIATQGLLGQYSDSHGQLMVVLHQPWIFVAALLRSILRRSGAYFSQMMGSYMGAFLVKNDMTLIYGVTAAIALISLIPFLQNRLGKRSQTEEKAPGTGSTANLSSKSVCEAPQDSSHSSSIGNGKNKNHANRTEADRESSDTSSCSDCSGCTDTPREESTAATQRDHRLGIKGRLNLLITSGVTVLLIFASEYILWTNYLGRYVDGIQGRYFIPIVPLMLAAFFGLQDNDMKKERPQYALLLGLNLCVALNAFASWLYLTGSTVAY